jgi:DNA-binding MarR family transcriptional regulator
MPAQAILNIQATLPAYPCGKPLDGRDRYGMTPEQGALYRWLVKNKPHHVAFLMHFRDVASEFNRSLSKTHVQVTALVERGWLEKVEDLYAFVQPVMHFAEPHNG